MALTDGIRGCWSPSLGATGRRVLDRSPFCRHATSDSFVSPEPTTSTGAFWRGSEVGSALDLNAGDGSGTTLWKANIHPAEFANELTVLQWCKLRTGGGSSRRLNLLYWADFSSTSFPFLQFYNNNNQTVAFYWGGAVSASNYAFGANWGMIAATWKTNDFTFFVNGRSVFQSTTNQMNNALSNIRIYWGDVAIAIDSSWGETAIYNRKLAASEIAESYRRGNGAIGRELRGQQRRRVYGFVPSGNRRRRLICGAQC